MECRPPTPTHVFQVDIASIWPCMIVTNITRARISTAQALKTESKVQTLSIPLSRCGIDLHSSSEFYTLRTAAILVRHSIPGHTVGLAGRRRSSQVEQRATSEVMNGSDCN